MIHITEFYMDDTDDEDADHVVHATHKLSTVCSVDVAWQTLLVQRHLALLASKVGGLSAISTSTAE